ncbi:hypothetical protein [Sphingomonas sp.]|uniref:hypothetical protein n=1 Tax=Sphingomonas sp. TaxID=28214 RepID=UPI0031E3688C
MTDHLDHDLGRLAQPRLPRALDDVERRVALAIEDAPSARVGPSARGLVLTGIAALALGLVGGGVMAGRGEVRERPTVMLAALDAGLAPSTLLLGR